MSSHYGHEGPLAAPGWYPDGRGQTRYWDGAGWTRDVAAAAPPPPSPYASTGIAPPFAPPGPPVGSGLRVSAKNPGLAVLGSFFFPGLGQLINGEVSKGIGFFVFWVMSIFLMVLLIGFVTAPLVWVWSMVDAYSGARQWNLRHGIIS